MLSTIGHLDGHVVHCARLVSDHGVEVDIIGLGAAVVGWRVPVAGGLRSVVLGSTDLATALRLPAYVGSVVGRVANRIPGAQFRLGSERYTVDANEGPTCLHGGAAGLSKQVWRLELDTSACAVRATHTSPHGAMGFPGTVDFEVTWRLRGDTLSMEVEARPDCPTPLALTQHIYFNLDGGGTILRHRLRVDADHTLAVDAARCPTGARVAVAGTVRDLRSPAALAVDGVARPLDHHFVLRSDRGVHHPPVELHSGDGALMLSLWTDRAGVQVYDGSGLPSSVEGWPGVGPWSGLCLEDQDSPAALAHPELGDIVYGPERTYRHRCRLRIGAP